ncbi:WxL domain-containing protein [Carnobacterium maltaromaticum]|uniref:WxL domain-containing protein n=1 Tax=Carnobacterium maltaromaticum TaxID=2751 RepID=UPI00295F5144|nr:WxL domain-containing protein [Carnobacterium maltaromaticum]
MKKELIAVCCLTSIALGGAPTIFANDEHTQKESEVRTRVVLENIPVPPAPGPIPPIIPPETLPDDVDFGINYVSDLNFGDIDFSKTDQTIRTQWDANLRGTPEDGDDSEDANRIYSYLSVRDYRADSDRNTWRITVERTMAGFAQGATLTMFPTFSAEGSEGTARASDFTIPSSVTIDGTATDFLTSENVVTGHVGFTLGNAELVIPAYTIGGAYSTKLTWNLIAEPEEL